MAIALRTAHIIACMLCIYAACIHKGTALHAADVPTYTHTILGADLYIDKQVWIGA